MIPNPIINVQRQGSAGCLGRRGAAGERLDLGISHCIALEDAAA
jgi:hypothetical protein